MVAPLVGTAMALGILGGIAIDIVKTTVGAPVVYAREEEPPRVIQIEERIDWTPERIAQEIETQAKRYGANAEVMKKVVECESMGSTTIQSHHTKNGVREESYGLSQIHLPSHPDVSKEEAQDPIFALSFMAKAFAEGDAWMWTCWKNLK